METAVIPLSDNALDAHGRGLGPKLASMPTRTLVAGGIGIVVLVAVLVSMVYSLRDSDHKLLFSNLGEKDGADEADDEEEDDADPVDEKEDDDDEQGRRGGGPEGDRRQQKEFDERRLTVGLA